MKKSLLLVLSAALLFVGCTKELEQKFDDLTARVDAVEAQVEANKAAIAELQKCDFITSVKETETGWVVETNTGKTLVLYNGKDGKDGDAFFKSVEVSGANVVITLVNGTQFALPLAAEFELVLDVNDVVAYPGQDVEIPFKVTGKTEKTQVYAIAGGEYIADIVGDKVVITIPDQELNRNRILVCADNGAGKVSTKSIDIDGQIIKSAKIDANGYFWGGTSSTITIPSNVPVTLELLNPADAVWCTLAETKAIVDHKFKASYMATPLMGTRTAQILVKDPAQNVVDTLTVAQGGTGSGVYSNATGQFHKTLAEAITASEATDKADVEIAISENPGVLSFSVKEVLTIPATSTKNYTITKRAYGATPAADPEKCTICGVNILGTGNVTIKDIRILAIGDKKNEELAQFGAYPYGVYVSSANKANIVMDNVTFFTYKELVKAEGTQIVVQQNSGANVTIQNCKLDGYPLDDAGAPYYKQSTTGNCRLMQLYGGKVTVKSNSIANGYSSYAVRVGNGADVTFTDNLVDSPVFVNVHNGATTKATFGDGKTDDNHYSKNVTTVATDKTSGAATILPASVVDAAPGEGANNVTWNGYGFATVQSAVTFASEGEILVADGTYKENVKVPAGKKLTIIGASQEGTIIAGDVEVMGNVTFKNLTIQSEKDITKKAFLDGDTYNAWWGFIIRAGSGSTLALENVKVYANPNFAGDTEACQYITALFAAQANITIKDCNFALESGKLFAPTQFFECKAVIEGTTFTTSETISGGCEEYVLKVAGVNNDVVIANNTFDCATAVYICGTTGYLTTGKITFGDGKVDDNTYTARVKKAIHSEVTAAQLPDLVLAPADVAFEKPTTGSLKLYSVWANIDGTMAQDTVANFAKCRNFVMTPAGIYAVNTDGFIAKYDLEGKFVKKVDAGIKEKVGQFYLDGAMALSDGTIIVTNLAMAETHQFVVYEYDGEDAVKQATSFNTPKLHGVAPRIGDYTSAYGTKDDYWVMNIDSPASVRIYAEHIVNGEVKFQDAYYNNGGLGGIEGLSFSCVGKYHNSINDYLVTKQTGKPAIIYSNASGWVGQTLAKDINLHTDIDNKLRTPEFFTIDGEDYMAICELSGADNTNSYGAKVYVYSLPNKNLVKDLTDATPITTFTIPSSTKNGNACGGLDVCQIDGKTYILVGLRSTGMQLLELR